MRDWEDLKFVLALSRAQTMRSAADALGTNAATVSRRIDRLTKEIGRQLFVKDKDGWRPTPEALRLIELSERLEKEMDDFERVLSRPDQELSGKISIDCYQAICQVAVVPNLAGFHARYPNMTLDIEYRSQRSLARSEIDLAIRLTRPTEGRLVSKRIGWRISGFFRPRGASPTAGWIGLSREFDNLPMMRQGYAYFRSEPTVRLGTLGDVEAGILQTGMAGPQLTCNARLREELQRIDSPDLSSVSPVFLVYHESRRNDPQLQVAREWLEGCFAGRKRCCCGHCDIPEGDIATI